MNTTSRFLDAEQRARPGKLFAPVLRVMASDTCIGLLHEFKGSLLRKGLSCGIDVLGTRLDRRLGFTRAIGTCMFGNKGTSRQRSTLVHLLSPLFTRFLDGWKERQGNGISMPPFKHVTGTLPPVWQGWKELRDAVCPTFKATFDHATDKTVMVLPGDTMTPKERINNLVDFKPVDRVGLGLTLTHATSFMGAQPEHGIGGLWQCAFGPGVNMAKATINTWIRLGGLDFFPVPMSPLAVPVPETHSPFYFDWMPPTDTIYEQFIEKELLKTYDRVLDWGLTSLARDVSKAVVFHAILGGISMLDAYSCLSRYFGKDFMNMFESYAGSIFALWDIIPMARGMIPFMKDLKKKPGAIIEAFECLEPGLTELGLAIATITRAKYVLLGNSRGSSSWVSPRMFEAVFWPTMKRTWNKIVKAGYKVCAHLDNDWTENMPFMLELPKHSGFFHLDQADLPRVRNIIGDHFCLMGNLQPAITVGSNPDVVYKETRKLIDGCGEYGGYIVSTGCEMPANVPVANFYAIKRAITDAGYFKR